MKQFKYRKNGQKGASTTDLLIGLGAIAIIMGIVVAKVPDIRYSMNTSRLESDISAISEGAFKWKKSRPNYTGLSMAVLCQRNILGKSICGTTNDGKATNPFGGDWTVAPNKNPGLYDITFTFPNDPERAEDLMDTVAGMTRGQCSSADDCKTFLKGNGTSITMTM